MDEVNDIFIHSEGLGKTAYQGGREIAQMSAMGYERFLVALYRWTREHGPRAMWLVKENGEMVPAADIERELSRVSREQSAGPTR